MGGWEDVSSSAVVSAGLFIDKPLFVGNSKRFDSADLNIHHAGSNTCVVTVDGYLGESPSICNDTSLVGICKVGFIGTSPMVICMKSTHGSVTFKHCVAKRYYSSLC